MPYVMIPVPEEHVEEAMSAVLRIISRGRLEDWDAEGIHKLFQEVDESARALLAITARSMKSGKPVTQVAAAEFTQLTQRELLGIMREVNDLAAADDRPALLSNQAASETLPNGRVRETRVFSMPDDVAEWIREAEKADLASAPHPLLGVDE